MKPVFRPYRRSDRKTCLDIFRSQVGRYLAEGEALDFEEFLDQLEERGQHYFVLVLVGDQPVGFGGVGWTGDIGSLTYGILRHGELSKGLGRALLSHRIGWVLANHPEVKSILCDTAPLTEGFFAKYGFETYHRAEKYWAGEIDLVAMEFSIDGLKRGPANTNRVVNVT